MKNISSTSSEKKLLSKLKFPKLYPLSFGFGILFGVVFTLGMVLLGLYEAGFFSSKQQAGISQVLPKTPEETPEITEKTPLSDEEAAQAFLKFREIKNSFIPSGVPAVYGQELNISFDQVQDAINKVAPLDPTYGQKKITLTGDDLKRYIDVGSKIACEFCCGVQTLVFENGEAACGCDHSQMMRGLSAYLIKNHPEISNDRILEELKKWKITYFPKQTLTQELDRRLKAGETDIQAILEEFPEFLPQMVGGC
jgi:hypothetical protein